MNALDIAVLLILAIAVLGGWYRGFLSAVLSFGATLLACLIAYFCISPVASLVKDNAELYNVLLYYTEGSEYVAVTDVELTRMPIQKVTLDQLNEIIDNAEMPLPMGARVAHNIAVESFAADGTVTLGDYFNRTIVCVVINIAAFAAVFLASRLLIGFLLQCIAHGRGGFPALAQLDGTVGAGIGLLHGTAIVFLLFLFVPIALTVLPKLYPYISESFFGEFFYRANVFIRLLPGV